jgi:two-component system, LuxR family, sensor kinase FixL
MELGEPRERETELGGQVYSLLFAPVRDLGYVNIYARDITAVRRAEQQSRQHQAELVHVCRLSTMGEVATGMAHEINQPLSAIVNYANGCSRRLQSGVGETEELVGAMAQIASQAQRASEIIRRLRALVGKQPPIRADVDLNHLVQEVCSFVEFETTKLGSRSSSTWPRGDPGGRGPGADRAGAPQSGAQRAGCPGGGAPAARRLVIRTQADATARPGKRGGQRTRASPGADAAPVRPLLHHQGAGMGMGLPISQTILENHGGTHLGGVAPGGGAVFHVRLPLAGAAEAAELAEPQEWALDEAANPRSSSWTTTRPCATRSNG